MNKNDEAVNSFFAFKEIINNLDSLQRHASDMEASAKYIRKCIKELKYQLEFYENIRISNCE